ncbi:unnamed protein product, partial [Ixodes pacificus]
MLNIKKVSVPLGAAAAPPAAGDAAAGAAPPPPDGIDASFSLPARQGKDTQRSPLPFRMSAASASSRHSPLAMTSSTDFPLSSLITFLTRSASLSMPTLPSIFST